MIKFVKLLGANSIRFNELQDAEDMYVDARNIFDNLTDNPYCDGCVQTIKGYSLEVGVKMTCGVVNKLKPTVARTEEPKYTTKVVYPSSEVSNGWRTTRLPSDNRHSVSRSYDGGCHQVSRGCH